MRATLRNVIVGAVLAIASNASAQDTPAQQPSYEAPPASLALPADFSMQAVQAARGNLAAWRNAERQRLGPPAPADYSPRRRITRQDIDAVGGYFAFFGSDHAAPGVMHGRWHDPRSNTDARSAVSGATYLQAYSVCDGVITSWPPLISEVTYLGPAWRPEFDLIDAELGPPETRRVTGPAPPQGVTGPVFAGPMELSRYYPTAALEQQREGAVSLSCLVQNDLRLRCGVVSEDPEGFGFALAALRALRVAGPVSATLSDGQASAGFCVRRTLPFRIP